MKKIIELLTEWKDNIECDANNADTWKEANIHGRNADKIRQAIALLQDIGKNNNIPE